MAASSSIRLLALHGLRLKGIAEPDALALTMDADTAAMRDELERLAQAELVTYRYGRIPGYLLTPEGRSLGARLVVDEVEETGTRPAIEAAYAEFGPVNDELLAVCTAWQLRDVDGERQVNDHRDPTHDTSVLRRLEAVHHRAEPVLGALGDALARFRGHRRRLGYALEQALAGDHDYLTRPMFPSYHSTWFELHEDLLATLGRERSADSHAGAQGQPRKGSA